MSAASHSVSSFTTEGGDSVPPKLIICSYPGCIEKTLSTNIFCHAHQLGSGLFAPAAAVPEPSDPPQPLRNSLAHPKACTEVARAVPSGIKSNKLLPENDKDRPILRRKTAPRDPFVPRPSNSRQITTASTSDDSTISPTSPKQTLARLPAHSPQGSPNHSRDSEHIRKRLKTSHPTNGTTDVRPNGAHAIAPDRGDFGVRHKLAKVQPHRPSYSSMQQRSGRGPESEKNGFRLSSHTRLSPPRKMAPQNLRPIPGLGGLPISTETQQPRTELPQAPAPVTNGFGLHGSSLSHPSVQAPLLNHNKDSHYFIENFNQPIGSHYSNKPPMLNGHAEQGSANNGTAQRFTAYTHPPHNQTHPILQQEHPEPSKSQPHVAPMPRIQKSTPKKGLSTRLAAPTIRQSNPVQPAITGPSKVIDEAAFDTLIYQQEGASTPPPEVLVPQPETPAPDMDVPDEPIYADVDPRIHWTLPQPEAWVNNKIYEIELRGGRKANFGRAAFSLKKQRLDEVQSSEPTLPDKILDNPAWLRALQKLESDAEDASVSQAANGTIKRKPGPKRQHSNGSGSNSVRGNIPELGTANRAG
ncbi:hypothetical protein V8F20_011540 [Naviculisporaceae sp. PSN 640]